MCACVCMQHLQGHGCSSNRNKSTLLGPLEEEELWQHLWTLLLQGLGILEVMRTRDHSMRWTRAAVLVETSEPWLNAGCVVGSECSPVPERDGGEPLWDLRSFQFHPSGGQLVCSPAVEEMQEPEGENGEELPSGQIAAAPLATVRPCIGG